MSSESREKSWQEFRGLMPVAERWAYLDHAAVAPIPRPTAEEVHKWAEQATYDGELACPEWYEKVDEVHSLTARMIGSHPEEVALVSNTSHGINIVAFGLDWRAGDNVVFPGHEFPTNQYPWMALRDLGVEARRVMPRPDKPLLDVLREACDHRTKLIAISWVQYLDGYRIDLDQACELAHQFGALLCLDAIQGLGVFPIDVGRTPVDFLAADGHKWLLGPEGAGVLFVRREHLDRLRPIGVGWHSVVHARDFSRIELQLKPSAARFEGGTHNVVGAIGLRASLEILLQFGADRISRRILSLTDYACEKLAELGAVIVSDRSESAKSGIVAFELPEIDPAFVRKKCLEAGVVLSVRGGKIRISPHAYNNEDDIDRLTEVIRYCQQSVPA